MTKHARKRNRHLTVATFLAAITSLGIHAVAQTQAPGQPAFGNFDIRVSKEAPGAAAYLERFAGASRAGEIAAERIAGIAQLQTDGKTLELIADGLARLLAQKRLDPAQTICAIISETGLKTEGEPPSRTGVAFDFDSLRRLVAERLA